MYDANNQRQIQGQGDQPSEEFAGASHDGLRQGEPFQRPDQSSRFRTVRRTRPLLWHGIEFASRGARSVTAVEINAVHYNFIRQTARELGCETIYPVKANAFLYLKSCPKQFDIVFSDAPYDLEGSGEIVRLVLDNGLLREGGLLIFEHSRNMDFSDRDAFWQLRSYGSVQFSFFKK